MSTKACWLAAASLIFALSAAGAELRTVALSGTPAPGTTDGWNFSRFRGLNLNDAGQTVFIAGLRRESGGSQDSVYVEAGDTLQLVARSGEPAPGTSGTETLGTIHRLVVNNEGNVAFSARIFSGAPPSRSGIEFPESGIWTNVGGSLQLVVRDGDPAPGGPAGATFSGIGEDNPTFSRSALAFNDVGQVAFTSFLSTTGRFGHRQHHAVWIGAGDQLSLVALSGASTPGIDPESDFRSPFSPPVLNSAGKGAFLAVDRAASESVRSVNRGIWSQGHGPLRLVARHEGPAPGAPGRVFENVFSEPVINIVGDTAFLGFLATEPGTIEPGIWSERFGMLDVVAREGDAAPGVSGAVGFRHFSGPVLNDSGDTAFRAKLHSGVADVTAGNDSGIWAERDGGLRLVAREGQPAPGTAGALFAEFFGEEGGNLYYVSVLFDGFHNSAGQVAFLGVLQSGIAGVDNGNRIGIWAEDRNGILHLVARTGDTIDVAPGDARVVRDLLFARATGEYPESFRYFARSGNGDGRPSLFNNLGQVVFGATFTDGSSGVFVSNVAAIPEPSAVVLAGIPVVAAAGRRRARRPR